MRLHHSHYANFIEIAPVLKSHKCLSNFLHCTCQRGSILLNILSHQKSGGGVGFGVFVFSAPLARYLHSPGSDFQSYLRDLHAQFIMSHEILLKMNFPVPPGWGSSAGADQ